MPAPSAAALSLRVRLAAINLIGTRSPLRLRRLNHSSADVPTKRFSSRLVKSGCEMCTKRTKRRAPCLDMSQVASRGPHLRLVSSASRALKYRLALWAHIYFASVITDDMGVSAALMLRNARHCRRLDTRSAIATRITSTTCRDASASV